MPKFVFPLQSALDWRSHLEEQALAEQVLARRHWQQIRQRLQALEGALAAARQTPLPLTGADVQNRAVYLEHLHKQVLACCQALREAEQQLAEKTQRYLECRRNREVLEKLKEKQYQHFCYSLQVHEQKKLDDLSGVRHWHKTRTGV
ncbi:MAG: flagellar export protein FliJ [Desulfurispora sp.]|uniref:flagellar export protein FliJ n=1 Tax=Desulfurispora sp. TaxID=3014275 RepID=UPI00404A3E77